MKKLLKWLLGILIGLAVIVMVDMMVCIHQYGKGVVTPWQVMEVNLFRKTVVLEEQDQEVLFLTDHDWTGDDLLDLGCRETDRMGDVGYYIAPDGTEFSVDDMNEWCFFFRMHNIKGITLEQLGLDP
ncbi:hypothetical protein SAMN02745687_02174 [Lachnospiraceae bacterium NK3A20]|nr:hypothetical protein SAMN02745687_02174 [Lachnospiraceae bacterium NK3A20]